MKVTPYFTFEDESEAAITLYTKAFNGTNQILRFSEMPPTPGFELPDQVKNRVLHGFVKFKDCSLLFSDNATPTPIVKGNSLTITIDFDTKEELNQAFLVLKEGANIEMEPQETFFAKWYTNFTDKFGTVWQFIFESING